jgi:hypothetical protein
LDDGPWNCISIPTSEDAIAGYTLTFADTYQPIVGWGVKGLNIVSGITPVVTGVSPSGTDEITVTMEVPGSPLVTPVSGPIPTGTLITFFPIDADPSTLIGGFDVTQICTPTAQMPMYFIVQGSDASLQCNFGASPWAIGPPGFFQGWPGVTPDGGGFAVLDVAKLGGTGTLPPSPTTPNTYFFSDSFYGACQTHEGWSSGYLYAEVGNYFNTFFTVNAGGGVGREFPGIDYNFWTVQQGGYGTGNPLGGYMAQDKGFPNYYEYLGGFDNVQGPIGVYFGGDKTTVGSTLRIALYMPPLLVPVEGVEATAEVGSLRVRNPLSMTSEETIEYPISPDRFVSLNYANDGGKVWSNRVIQSLGEIGRTETQVQFRQLGYGRDRVYNLEWSSPYATALTGLVVEADALAS